ncbi:hypothetical protein K470DRAFT_284208 [Piedraia hortae CBS 480.64]|uniref:Cryptic loci regulator 2 N-terminal domain-containing protein n=1 Tax=Piedraia hortae CBS 480.64 TaxID=1314780 RepID=A0A6A7CC67_9PEZI|nr:hypothetical protein K470DRAFT_284208 [Piedraia hortae CBS 480.64]
MTAATAPVTLPINNDTDGIGVASFPKPATDKPCDSWWLKGIGLLWAADLGYSWPVKNFVLDRLLDGYAGYPKTHGHGKTRKSHYALGGYPSGKEFRNLKRFYPYFQWLVEGKQGQCVCSLCASEQSHDVEDVAGDDDDDDAEFRKHVRDINFAVVQRSLKTLA